LLTTFFVIGHFDSPLALVLALTFTGRNQAGTDSLLR